jgi:hypothetical protein
MSMSTAKGCRPGIQETSMSIDVKKLPSWNFRPSLIRKPREEENRQFPARLRVLRFITIHKCDIKFERLANVGL